MKRALLFKTFMILLFSMTSVTALAQSDYHKQMAEKYTQEAEYYQKKADRYHKDARYYLKQAARYEDSASSYLKKGDSQRALTEQRYAKDAIRIYNIRSKDAKEAETRAARCLRRATDELRR